MTVSLSQNNDFEIHSCRGMHLSLSNISSNGYTMFYLSTYLLLDI